MLTKRPIQLDQIALSAGKDAFAELEAEFHTEFVVATLRLPLNVTTGGANVRNFGSPWAAIRRIGMDENGAQFRVDPLHFVALSEYLRGSKGTARRLTATGVANYTGATALEEQVIIPFAYLVQVAPRESAFLAANPGKKLRLFAELDVNGADQLLNGGVKVIGQATIDLVQHVDSQPGGLPLFKPDFQEETYQVKANAEHRVDLQLDADVRAVTIMQKHSAVGVVSDIIESFSLRGGDDFLIGGAKLIGFRDFALSRELLSGGDVFATMGGGIVHIDFCKGKLGQRLEKYQATNLRWIFKALPSVAGGAGDSEIRILYHKLTRPSPLAGGRPVVADQVALG